MTATLPAPPPVFEPTGPEEVSRQLAAQLVDLREAFRGQPLELLRRRRALLQSFQASLLAA